MLKTVHPTLECGICACYFIIINPFEPQVWNFCSNTKYYLLNLLAPSRTRKPVQGPWVQYTLIPTASAHALRNLCFSDVSWPESPGIPSPVWKTIHPHPGFDCPKCSLQGLTLHPRSPTTNLAGTFDEAGYWSGSRSGAQIERTLEKVSSQLISHWEITCPRGLRESWPARPTWEIIK